jgi:ribonuclease PH
VLQADGGTRTASITGGCVALALALSQLERQGKIPASARIDTVAAVSVGIKEGNVLVDLDYDEDSTCDVDMNFVVTGKGLFVEVQGTAERQAFSKADLDRMTEGALRGLTEIKRLQEEALGRFSR